MSLKPSALTAEEKNARMTEERHFLTKLLESSLQGKLQVIKELVAEYRTRNPLISRNEILEQFKDGKKRTVLYFICQSDNPTILEELVQWLEVDFVLSWLKLKDINGMTALMVCAQHPNPELAYHRVQFLLNLNNTCDATSTTTNSNALSQRKLALARSNIGATALHYAAGAGALPETIAILVQAAKVAVSTSSTKGGTPLHWAASLRTRHLSTLQALVDAGADWNSKNDAGLTPLLLAAAAENDSHSKFFVEQGADITEKLPGDVSIFHIAADCNLVATLALLMERYPNSNLIHQPNSRGETPLDLAVQANNVGCVMLLTGEGDETKAKEWIEQYKSSLAPREKEHDGISSKSGQSETNESEVNKDESSIGNMLEKHAMDLAAKVAATKVTEADKKRAEEFKIKGNLHFANKEWDSAISCYTSAIDADPTDAIFYSNRSACYMQLLQYNEALQDAVMCRTLRPDWPKACYRMAVARLALQRYEDAALSAWEGLKLDEDHEELKRLLQKCVKHGRKFHRETIQKDADNESK